MSMMHSDPDHFYGIPQRVDVLALQWAALREAAVAVGELAKLDVRGERSQQLAFPAGLREAPERRRIMIEQAIGDLVAMMEPGVAAVLSVHERGGDAVPAARALWDEFVAARQALLGLVPPSE